MSDLNHHFDGQEDLSTAKGSDGYSESVVTPNHDLTRGSIPQHFKSMAVPIAIGMVFNTLYSVVDTFFAGLISTDSQAGLAIASQVFFFLIAIGFGLSTAMGALVGNAYGEGLPNKANRIAQQGVVFGVLVSIFLTLLALEVSPLLVNMISTPGFYRDAANDYLDLLLLGAVFFLLGFGVNGILQARGDTSSMKHAQVAAFFANLILNPLCIFGVPGIWDGLGFNGLALSTLISQAGVMFYMLYRLYKVGVFENIGWQNVFKPDWQVCKLIVSQAVPSTFTMMIMIAAGFVIQYFLKSFGSEAIAGYGIALRIEQLVFLPVFGLTGSLMPIAAQSFGAGNVQRVREAAFFCVKFGCVMMLVSGATLWMFGPLMMSLFTSDPEVIKIGVSYLRVGSLIHWAYLILMAVNALLQAFKKPVWTMIIGIYRQGVGVAFFGYIYVVLFDWGVMGIWIGIATSVITGMMLSIVIIETTSRKLIGGLFWSKSPA